MESMEIRERLRSVILGKYRNLSQFSRMSGIPYRRVHNFFYKDIKLNKEFLEELCKFTEIPRQSLNVPQPTVLTEEEVSIVRDIRALPREYRKTASAVVKTLVSEYQALVTPRTVNVEKAG